MIIRTTTDSFNVGSDLSMVGRKPMVSAPLHFSCDQAGPVNNSRKKSARFRSYTMDILKKLKMIFYLLATLELLLILVAGGRLL